MNNEKTPDNYIPRKIIYRKIKTGYDLKKILLNITDYKTVHELNNFYKTEWVPLDWLEIEIQKIIDHQNTLPRVDHAIQAGANSVLELLKKKKQKG